MHEEDQTGVGVVARVVERQAGEVAAELLDALDRVGGYEVGEQVDVLGAVLVEAFLRGVGDGPGLRERAVPS